MDAYRYLAPAYNGLMSDVDYDVWALYIDRLLDAKNLRIFEAACGTGNITSRLYDKGHDIVASDISAEMLDAALRESRKNGREIVFVRQDMRRISAHGRFDAVICACDGVNYVDGSGLTDFARASYNLLKPGGRLLFDISSPHKLKAMDGQVYYDDGEECTCIWHNRFDSGGNFLKMDVTLFMRRGTLYEKMTEQHIQFAHETDEVIKAMNGAGYSHVSVYDAFTETPASECSERIQFVCRKV